MEFENIDEGVKKSSLVAKLKQSAVEKDILSDAEKRKSKAKRENVLKNLDQNYEK